MYKTISINQIASEFFHSQKLPASGDPDVPESISFPGDLSGRSLGSQVRVSPAKAQGWRRGQRPKCWALTGWEKI